MSAEKNNHRRYNPLLDEWVIVAENRMSRPWNGAHSNGSTFCDSKDVNPLAPGGRRANGKITEEYSSTFVFDNDFPSFTNFNKENEKKGENEGFFFKKEEIRGVCRVICYHPDTRKSMAVMDAKEIRGVVDIWVEQFRELKKEFTWIQIFENRGAAVGCSNAHPHGQLWAGDFLPNLQKRKDRTQREYTERTGRVMLLDYLEEERAKKERILLSNEHWTWLVPFWAVWPFETMLIANRHVQRMDELSEMEKSSLADITKQLFTKYDNIFECDFSFGMGWLGAPTGEFLEKDCAHWQLHAIYHPPLLRSATVPKFMAGYEILAEPQRDITAEAAAQTIRKQSDVHYSLREK